MLTLGSLFDGIGGWQLAAIHAGVKPVWASEIDKFPSAVSAYHFPDVKQLGDITKIDVNKLESVDIICAGSPCQDLSVAGKREGLAGVRSGLFNTAIELVHGLRERTGKPRYFVWENVCGAFSTNKGHDFRTVLEKITKTKIPMPAGGRWAESGMVEWNGGSLAWRVLDAQYWGVPQRRKRIFLVADFGGYTAGKILFECESVSGYSAEGEGTRKEIAADVGTSVDNAISTLGFNANASIADNAPVLENRTPTMRTTNGLAVIELQTAFREGGFGEFIRDNVCGTSRAGKNGNETLILEKNFNMRKVGCLCAGDAKGIGNQYVADGKVVIDSSNKSLKAVRRLTPLECERLQGLPDGYTDIIFNGKSAPDTRRYKAIGNGMAQICADYVIRQIVEVGKS